MVPMPVHQQLLLQSFPLADTLDFRKDDLISLMRTIVPLVNFARAATSNWKRPDAQLVMVLDPHLFLAETRLQESIEVMTKSVNEALVALELPNEKLLAILEPGEGLQYRPFVFQITSRSTSE